MPRRYTLGKRAGQKQATRQRILDAAAVLYQERGVGETTIPEVARRADVAPGTVLNHFASADDLARAVVEQVMATLRLPTERRLADTARVRDRVAGLAADLFEFYERSEPWYLVHSREPAGIPAWADAEASFYAESDRLIKGALGPLAADDSCVAIVSTMLGGGVYASLRARGLATPAATALVVEMLAPWLDGKVATM